MKKKENWENELYIDPRPLNEEDKKIISSFIKNYRPRMKKKLIAKTSTRPTKKKKIKA
jgi:hypothetical protein